MSFVNEYMSKEDERKYGFSQYWTVDREAGVFLISSGINKEKNITFELRHYSDGKLIAKMKAIENLITKASKRCVISYDVLNLFIQEGSGYSNITTMLKDAVVKHSMGLSKSSNVEVRVVL